jgi:hypothetical protein
MFAETTLEKQCDDGLVGVLVLVDLYINCIARLLSPSACAGLEQSLAGCSDGWSLVNLPYSNCVSLLLLF